MPEKIDIEIVESGNYRDGGAFPSILAHSVMRFHARWAEGCFELSAYAFFADLVAAVEESWARTPGPGER